jgi:hypothetical protein
MAVAASPNPIDNEIASCGRGDAWTLGYRTAMHSTQAHTIHPRIGPLQNCAVHNFFFETKEELYLDNS